MGKVIRRVRGEAQKNIIKLIEGLTGRFSMWEVWQDFIIMSAISIANAVDLPQRDAREKEYLSRAAKYSPAEIKVFAEMLGEVVSDMEYNPDQDFLGELFMTLNLSNEWNGQFFTPYSVCRAMAAISCGDDFKTKIENQGWISVNDSACGAGALLLAFANECRLRNDINYQTSVLFVAQDIDYLAGMMCYIQMSLMGCPGYVVIANTLTNPNTSYDSRGLLPIGDSNIWFTPMYFRDVWNWRRIWTQMNFTYRSVAPQGKAEEPAPELPSVGASALVETKTGQLTLF